MSVHELATNAAKYGALSAANGRVEARWGTLAGEPGNQQSLQLRWVEHNGPPVDGPRPAGFGISFLKRSVEYELTGKANLELSPEGLRCNITFPVAGNIEEIPPEGG